MKNDNFIAALKQRSGLITQQEVDDLVEKREIANRNHGVSSEDRKVRKENYDKLRKKFNKRYSEGTVNKLLSKDNRSHKHLG